MAPNQYPSGLIPFKDVTSYIHVEKEDTYTESAQTVVTSAFHATGERDSKQCASRVEVSYRDGTIKFMTPTRRRAGVTRPEESL